MKLVGNPQASFYFDFLKKEEVLYLVRLYVFFFISGVLNLAGWAAVELWGQLPQTKGWFFQRVLFIENKIIQIIKVMLFFSVNYKINQITYK